MELFSEKQITRRAPIRPLEANYVNADVKDLDSDDGYQLQFPQNWAAHASTNKVIGVRRLLYRPCATTVNFSLYIFSDPVTPPDLTWWEQDPETGLWTPGEYVTETPDGFNYDETVNGYAGEKEGSFQFMFTSNNTLEEIAVGIQDTVNASLTNYRMSCLYDPDTLGFQMYVVDNDGESTAFKITFSNLLNESATNFLKIFNQKTTDENIAAVKLATWKHEFTNVWNRQDLYFHASFSDSTRQIIGVNGDVWTDANVYYGGNLNSDDFTVRFTQNTVTRVVPRHGVLLMQFSLIYNYENSLVM